MWARAAMAAIVALIYSGAAEGGMGQPYVFRHHVHHVNLYPSALRGDDGLFSSPSSSHCCISRSAAVEEGYNQTKNTRHADKNLSNSKSYLPPHSIRNGPLNLQVLVGMIFLTALGCGACIVTAWCIVRAFDLRWDTGRWRWLSYAALGVAMGFTLWGWALYGHWWSFWVVGADVGRAIIGR